MNKITIRIIPNTNIKIFLSIDSAEIPLQCYEKNNLEMWR